MGVSEVLKVLDRSLKLVIRRPELFLPKFISRSAGAIWFLLALENRSSPLIYLLTLPFVIGLGFYSSVAVAEMVRSKKSGKKLIFHVSRLLVRKTPRIGFITVFLTFFVVISSLPASTGFFLYITEGSIVFAGIGVFITILTGSLATLFLYFLPVTATEEASGLRALKEAKSFSLSNLSDTASLTLISLLMAAVALMVSTEFRTLGYAGFIAARMLSGVVSTYIFVVGPEYYYD
ncbi:MAG: hypothetical protein ABEJ03_05455 [Candidatus Nanohaloarchaea archaeon]